MTTHHTPTPMQSPATTELTAIAQDYLKAIWSATEWGSPPATVKSLATRFEVTAASASDSIRRLAANGLIEHEPYGAITLTEQGQRHALEMVRRHRLIETFLQTTLGYSATEVHAEAEHLEHAVSELMVDRIDTLLGHPDRDPHGDPIPRKDGTITYPSDAQQLTTAPKGDHEIVRVSDADPSRLHELTAAGFTPGSRVTVTRNPEDAHTGVAVITAAGETISLTDYCAEGIYLVRH